MLCPKCGNQMHNEDGFCSKCGIAKREPPASSSKRVSINTTVPQNSPRIVRSMIIGLVLLLSLFTVTHLTEGNLAADIQERRAWIIGRWVSIDEGTPISISDAGEWIFSPDGTLELTPHDQSGVEVLAWDFVDGKYIIISDYDGFDPVVEASGSLIKITLPGLAVNDYITLARVDELSASETADRLISVGCWRDLTDDSRMMLFLNDNTGIITTVTNVPIEKEANLLGLVTEDHYGSLEIFFELLSERYGPEYERYLEADSFSWTVTDTEVLVNIGGVDSLTAKTLRYPDNTVSLTLEGKHQTIPLFEAHL